MAAQILTQEYLKKVFDYSDGQLIWKESYSINNPFSGKPTGTCKDKNGYGKVTLTLDGKKKYFRVHRLIFMYHNGYMPEKIDHIDRDVSNNRIENLRPANANQNQWNRGGFVRSKSGIRGVVMKNNRWYAQCKAFGKRHHLGCFGTIEEAEKAVKKFRKENHLEYSNE